MSSNTLLNFSASSFLDNVTNVFTIAASGSVTLDLDLTDCYTINGEFEVNYGSSSAVPLTCQVFQGYGPGILVNMYQPVPCYLQLTASPTNPRSTGQTYSTIGLQTTTGGDPIIIAGPSSSSNISGSPFALDKKFMSKFVSFKLTNPNVSGSVQVKVRLNV